MSYLARVWMHQTLVGQIEREAEERIEALLPGGYRYRVDHGETPNGYGGQDMGWSATFGDGEARGYGLGHRFRTRAGAMLGLLAVMVDGLVYPGCQTAFQTARAVEQARQDAESTPGVKPSHPD